MPFDGEAAALCRSMMRRIEDDAAMTIVHYCAWSLSLMVPTFSDQGVVVLHAVLHSSIRYEAEFLVFQLEFDSKGASSWSISFIERCSCCWKSPALIVLPWYVRVIVVDRSSFVYRSCLVFLYLFPVFIQSWPQSLVSRSVIMFYDCESKPNPCLLDKDQWSLEMDGDKKIIVWTIIFLVNGLIRTFIVI